FDYRQLLVWRVCFAWCVWHGLPSFFYAYDFEECFLGLIIAVKYQRVVCPAGHGPVIEPRLFVVHPPEGYAADFVLMFQEKPEQAFVIGGLLLLHAVRQAAYVGVQRWIACRYMRTDIGPLEVAR